jgi:hypothetical protein
MMSNDDSVTDHKAFDPLKEELSSNVHVLSYSTCRHYGYYGVVIR